MQDGVWNEACGGGGGGGGSGGGGRVGMRVRVGFAKRMRK